MKAVTAEQMREIDRISIDEMGIPEVVLMNNAGRALAEAVSSRYKDVPAIVFCGGGNNGGDGFTAAYYLKNSGIDTAVYLSCRRDKLSQSSSAFLKICDSMNIPVTEVTPENLHEIIIPENSVVIDATLGTGFTGSPRGIILEFIRIINSSGCKVFSADIPGGLPSDGSGPDAEAVKADYTVTMGLPKISLVTYPGKKYTGELIVADIGFPHSLTAAPELKTDLIDREMAVSIINRLTEDEDQYKGMRGHTLLIGGFPGMEGAIMLAASALMETGCGLATVLTTTESRAVIAGKIPEVMTASLPGDDNPLKDYIRTRGCRTIVIGPGMGRSEYASLIFMNLMELLTDAGARRILIDGDGLFHLAEYLKNHKLPSGPEFVITPHFMEASRISGNSVEKIKKNRYLSCIDLSVSSGAVALLKGPYSIISDGENTLINTSGTKNLATAGSGDVLSGIIASLLNREIPTVEACAAGAYIHGRCAEINDDGVKKAGDIIGNIKKVLSEFNS